MTGILGLDLGKQMDPSALAGIHYGMRPNLLRPAELEAIYDVLSLHRWARGTPYMQVVTDVCTWVSKPPWQDQSLAFDKGNAGGAVFEMFQVARPSCWLRPITITGGRAVTPQDDGGFNVAKSELASVLVAVHASGRIRIAPQPEAKVLVQQIAGFTEKITKDGAQSFDNQRDETGHGDVAMAVALAIWLGERTPIAWDGSLGLAKTAREGGSVVADAPRGMFASDTLRNPWAQGGRHVAHDAPEEEREWL